MALTLIPDELVQKYNKGEIKLVWVMPGSAQENPLQWKDHPPEQLEALNDLIFGKNGVGWAGAGLINDRRVEDGWSKDEAIPVLLDGHARDALSSLKGEEPPPFPAIVGHWPQEQEELILLYLDPIKDMATIRPEVLIRLIDGAIRVPQGLSKLTIKLKNEAEFRAAVAAGWEFSEDGNHDDDNVERKHLFVKVFIYDETRLEELIGSMRQLIEDGDFDAEITL